MSVTGSKRSNDKNQLTERQKSVIQILTKSSATHPITIGMISDSMGVSSRTILREIPAVEAWLTQNDFHLIRKPSVGLILDESLENKRLILELLEIETVHKAYPKEERRRRILGELLYATEPTKSYYFTSKFNISEGTLSSDLNHVSEWLKSYDIELIRRPGLGIFLKSREENYRQAIANVIYESMDEQEIMQLICGGGQDKESSVRALNRVFDLLDNSMMSKVEHILLASEKKLHIKYTDSAYIGLIVHIALAIQRIQNGEKIDMEDDRLQKLMMRPEFSIAEELADWIEEEFDIKIPKGEIGYITMHLSSSQIWSGQNGEGRNIDRVTLRQMSIEIIELVERELGMELSDIDSLLEDMCTHLAPAVSRMTMGIHIENSQMETLNEEYPKIMQATDKACQKVLCRELGIDEVPQSEVSFFAMHFGAAVEKKLERQKRVAVMVVCPTGVGTSRILEANLKKEFSFIDVRGAMSMFRIEPDELRAQGIDLIISTVNLTADFPCIVVSPLLQARDRRTIEQTILSMQAQKSKRPRSAKPEPFRDMTVDDIDEITRIGIELRDMLDHMVMDTVEMAKNRDAVIAKAGELFAEDERMAADIENGLYERDQLADTYIKQFHALMLHCTTTMVEHARIGYLKLEPPLYENGKVIFGAFVMLAPEGGEIARKLIGAVSAITVQDKSLTDKLRIGDWDGSRKSLEAGLSAYYKLYLMKRLGVEGK